MEVIIKKAREEDIPLLFSHYKGWLRNLFPEYSENLKKGFIEKDFNEDFLSDKMRNGIVLLAYADEKMTGVLIAGLPEGGISYCNWVIVDSSFQKKGIGKTLLDHWESEVKRLRGHGLRLDVDERNKKYYEKMGFKMIGFHEKGYFGLNSYYFQKTIAEPKEENFF